MAKFLEAVLCVGLYHFSRVVNQPGNETDRREAAHGASRPDYTRIRSRLPLARSRSPAVVVDGEKIGSDVIDLRTNERRRLADRFNAQNLGPDTQRWSFHADSVERGDTVLRSATSCEVLIVDEPGVLEFDRGEGWQAGLRAIDAGDYRAGVAVIRPELLSVALRRWPHAQVIDITTVDQARRLTDRLRL